jgi:hypothetical protein
VVWTGPTSITVKAGATATFTASATGTPTPAVQWQISTNGGAAYANIAGATSLSYSFIATTAQNGDKYRAVFTNSAGTATTLPAALTVTPASATAPVVWTGPTSQKVQAGKTATFTASANGNPTPTVQWEISTNGGSSYNFIPGATSLIYTLTATLAQNGDDFEALFTDLAGTAVTLPANLTVT